MVLIVSLGGRVSFTRGEKLCIDPKLLDMSITGLEGQYGSSSTKSYYYCMASKAALPIVQDKASTQS